MREINKALLVHLGVITSEDEFDKIANKEFAERLKARKKEIGGISNKSLLENLPVEIDIGQAEAYITLIREGNYD